MSGRSKELVGLVVVLVITGVSALVFTGILQGTLQESGTTVRAQFADTGRLAAGDPVRVEGVRVGRVKEVDLDDDGRTATVELDVLDDATPVYADARAVIRWRTVLGGAFAVDLDRGSPSAGELGDTVIPAKRTDNQVALDDILTTFRARELAGLKTMLSETPVALAEPDDLGTVVDGLSDVSPTVTSAIGAVRGDRGDIARLVRSTARTVRAVDGPSEPIRDVIEGAAVTLRTTAGREAEIRATLTRGARVVPQARTTLARLERTLDKVDPLVADLQKPAGKIAPTIDRLRPVLTDADRLLDDARPLLRTLRPTVTSLARTARTGAPLLQELEPALDRLAEKVLPRLAVVDKVSKRPAYQMIGPTFAGLNSVASRFDSGGHIVKLSAQFGERPLQTLPCSTYVTDPSREELVNCDQLVVLLQQVLGGRP